MVSVNLLPPNVTATRRRRERTRLWIVITATVTAVTAIPLALDVTNSARAAAIESRIGPQEARRDGILTELKETTAKCASLSTQIARADALRTKRDWAGLLTLVAERTPDSVWLTALKTQTRQGERPAPVSSSKKGKAPEKTEDKPVTLDGPSGIHLEGYALTHEALYEFMGALKAAEVFTTVELASADKEPVLEGTAVRFVIECVW
ncbi:MAG: PilN domain-containing protein [Phycisphaerales bacterium]|nr:PilN domain-containing protein [Phycisphaerales bacterium]